MPNQCEVGQKFGFLVVLRIWYEPKPKSPTQKLWLCECRCDCGQTLQLPHSALVYDGKMSCGCEDRRSLKTQCLSGECYGKLTVVRNWREKPENAKAYRLCECLCVCGNTVIVKLRALASGHKKSCGCNRRGAANHLWKGCGKIGAARWTRIKSTLNRGDRVIDFTLSIEEAWNLYETQGGKCALSGVPIGFSGRLKNGSGVKNDTASLDRIDSSKGYTLENVQWVHKIVNLMKMSLTQEEFIKWCHTITENNNE